MTETHSQRAMAAAIAAFGMTDERAAAVYIFIAAARHLGRVVADAETAAELAYMMADELATERPAMSALPWFKCYPHDFREGMTGLTCEERGAYTTVLLLIYERAAPIPDDDSWLAAHLWCSVRAWKKIRAALIVKGKLYAVSVNGIDSLMNERAADELAKTAGICTARSEAGKEGGKRSAANRTTKSNENNETAEAIASQLVKQTPSNDQPDITDYKKDSEANASAGEPASVNSKAWASAVALLIGQGGMTSESARAFGKLLSGKGLEASDLLGAIGEAEHQGTRDPQGFLTKAAAARSRRREPAGPAKRVGFV